MNDTNFPEENEFSEDNSTEKDVFTEEFENSEEDSGTPSAVNQEFPDADSLLDQLLSEIPDLMDDSIPGPEKREEDDSTQFPSPAAEDTEHVDSASDGASDGLCGEPELWDVDAETENSAHPDDPHPEQVASPDSADSSQEEQPSDSMQDKSDAVTSSAIEHSSLKNKFRSLTASAASRPRERKDRPAHKGRPRRRKGYGFLGLSHIAAAVIWLVIIVAVGVSLGRMIWVSAADVLAFGRDEKEVVVTITSEDTIDDIARKLHEAGLVRYPGLFKFYADLAVDEGEITTGTFTLNTLYDYHALVNNMSPKSGNRKVIEDVLIPEGFSCRQIFALLEEKGICKASELEAYAASGELKNYWFLEGLERGDKYCLEGFLFPDTYDFYENSNPRHALEKMLSNFDHRFSDEMKENIAVLNTRLTEMMSDNGCSQEYIDAHQFSIQELVTVASLIEKEMADDQESYRIASVIYNRLFHWGDNPRYLNIDAAIFYALGEHKEALTAEDLQIDSPYNTYTHQGLVPGPIANPGLTCLQAALDPEDTGYYYYVLDPEAGTHHFSKTYEEHQKFIDSLE